MLSAASKVTLAALGGIAGAIGSVLCCAGPLVAVALGMSGAGLAMTFEPFRPYFAGGALLSLGFGFIALRREERQACRENAVCASPVARRRMRSMLWIATVVFAALLAFPLWSPFVIE